MTTAVTVIVCTHNPRPDYWAEVMAALGRQTLGPDKWELIVIDNASAPGSIDADTLEWHPNARIVIEQNLGLTVARLRGIAEASGDLLVFVDDDNVLESDYLEAAVAITIQYPFISAFSGSVRGRFETPPPDWALPYLSYLAIVDVQTRQWSNVRLHNPCCPRGTGLCIRRTEARRYAEIVRTDPRRRALDRIGSNLSSCGDTDMALAACDDLHGVGLFPELRLEHLIPSSRLTPEYLYSLVRSIVESYVVLCALRGEHQQALQKGRAERLLKAYQRLHLGQEARLLDRAVADGHQAGVALLQQHAADVNAAENPIVP